ncbi:iron chelate uptake ABC transporter family permease subunit [Pseudonocardia tropica]|uniref:Iron chelate uptake ABC transporter family permease subunit n=1 Tax=Pseudonocardia tropica TaxID=681289 RepID=A0ABV1JYT3_9PSEU
MSTLVLRSRSGRVSLRVHRRVPVVLGALVIALLVVAVAALGTGSVGLSPGRVSATLLGQGTRAEEFVVLTLRLPRLLTGLLIGAALGVSGAIFQSLTRNPLGSPDVIGFSTGAATGAIVAIIVIGTGPLGVAAGAVLGGIGTALLVYGLAFRRGVEGFRLILIGLGTTAMLAAFNAYLISRAQLADAQAAQFWLTGSLNGRDGVDVATVAVGLAVLLPPLVPLARPLAMLESGDDAARARGVAVEPVRLALTVVGVALVAVATAVAGPIGFVALAAPQLARRLARSPAPALTGAALLGALLLTTADLAVARLSEDPLPVGVGTAAVGGLYLAWLLATERRRRAR